MAKKDRRFPRYQLELPVLLKDKRYTQEMVTGDVSRHGVFLRCEPSFKYSSGLLNRNPRLSTNSKSSVRGYGNI